jgi:hypothetical protein
MVDILSASPGAGRKMQLRKSSAPSGCDFKQRKVISTENVKE